MQLIGEKSPELCNLQRVKGSAVACRGQLSPEAFFLSFFLFNFFFLNFDHTPHKNQGYFKELESTAAQIMSLPVYSLQAHQSGCLQWED